MNYNLEKRTASIQRRHARYTERLHTAQNWRLVSGLGTFASLVLAAFDRSTPLWSLLGFALGPIVFGSFVVLSRRLTKFTRTLQALCEFYQRHNQRRQGLAPSGSHTVSVENESAIARDLDLLQPHSLFHLLDETFSPYGRSRLVEWMLNPLSSGKEILARQEDLRKMARHRWMTTKVLISGRLQGTFSNHERQLKDFVERAFLSHSFSRDEKILYTLFALSILSLLNAWVLHWIEFLPTYLFPALHFFYSLVSTAHLKGIFERANNMALHLKKLMPVLGQLERAAWDPDLQPRLNRIRKLAPSSQMKQLNFVISALSIQGHPIIFLVVNGLMPWNFFFSRRLENIRLGLKETLPPALSELADFEALSSLSLFYCFHTQNFGDVLERPTLEFVEAYHPLIERHKVVSNDFRLHSKARLNLLTGSNMSGKSTFLRTIGINHLLFLMGAPVCAKEYRAYPFPLITCIRVTDSLDDGFSYFYAEVLRLKEIIERVEIGEPILYLVDEIFKGTNNRERLAGSRSLLLKMSDHPSIGFVTTHDLELTTLANSDERIQNYHFKDDVNQAELVFDYKIQHGPCPTTNALKIMAHAGLPVPTENETSP